MRIKLFYLILLTCSAYQLPIAFAQKVQISGYVRSAEGKEKLIGAHIFNKTKKTAAISDHNGYFSTTALANDTLVISYAGFKSHQIQVLREEWNLVIDLMPDSQLQEVHVTAYPVFQPLSKLKSREIANIPTIGAAPDVLKAVQLFPGITAQNEGSSQLIVRGGSPGENLYLIDNIPLIYVNHLGGFYSVFNPDMINAIDIHKDAFPSKYGGKLSSIISISQYDGNADEFKGNFSIGPLAASLMLEGPALNKKITYMFSARKTLIDGLMALGTTLSQANTFTFAYGFHDLNGKVTYNRDDKNTFSINFYQGDDYLNLWAITASLDPNEVGKTRAQTIWGSWMGAVNWRYKATPKILGENSVSVVNYRLKNKSVYFENVENSTPSYDNRFRSSLIDYRIHSDWTYFHNNSLTTFFGAQSSNKIYQPNSIETLSYSSSQDTIRVSESSIYLEEELNFFNNSSLKVGARYNYYRGMNYDFGAFAPRAQLAIGLNSFSWLTASYTRANQFAHLLYTTGDIGASEIWVPATEEFPVSQSDQVTAGYKGQFNANWRIETALYHKTLHNLSTYREGIPAVLGDGNWRNKVTSGGKGLSYGWELMLKKITGKWTGFVAYTLSNTTYQFPEINQGQPYLFEYDRPHNFSINVSRKINERWDFSANWTYQTGLPFTPAIGIRATPDPLDLSYERETLIYGERNSARMRDYHRLDLGFNYHKITKRGNDAVWSFSIYNAYNRQNPYFNYYHVDGNTDFSQGQLDYSDEPYKLYQRSFFPILPSFSYKVYFDKDVFKKRKVTKDRERSKWLYHKL